MGEFSGASLFGRARGSWTGFDGGTSSLQGSATVAGWLSPLGPRGPLRLELGGTVAGSRYSSDFDARVAEVDVRVHLLGSSRGAWVGLGAASAKNSYDTASVGAWLPGAGAWLQSGRARGSLSVQLTRVDGQSYPELAGSLLLSEDRLDVTLFAGAREWPGDGGLGDELWGGATASYWITSNAAVTVSGGKYAWDVLQGLTGGTYASVGLKLTPRRVRPVPIFATAPIVFTTEQARDGAIGFEVEGARRVEIAGDWTGWTPIPLGQDVSGRWLLPADLEPGAYRFNLRVDGERWMVPEGFPTLDDGFGGTVGLLIVAEPDSGL